MHHEAAPAAAAASDQMDVDQDVDQELLAASKPDASEDSKSTSEVSDAESEDEHGV